MCFPLISNISYRLVQEIIWQIKYIYNMRFRKSNYNFVFLENSILTLQRQRRVNEIVKTVCFKALLEKKIDLFL